MKPDNQSADTRDPAWESFNAEYAEKFRREIEQSLRGQTEVEP